MAVPEPDTAPKTTAPAKKAGTRKSAKAEGTTRTRAKAAAESQADAQPPSQAPASAKADGAKAAPAAAPRTASGRRRLTDAASVLAALAQGDGPLRAGEVTALLGLDHEKGAADAVRAMLERLHKDGRAERTGRGLYAVATH
ncbi:type IV toxin-antitoxin system AbiEi family antitoxin domain-containing protein [Kitasatospora cinereorecta]|uniref:Type IV toxin-antitoxin system AbiEi family antitoxin domain-containing protein n=1 Tax=Kitasatospora cinereorecta TaxID=285560 RepID=A0ABW0VNM1_9ACTN